MESLRLSSHIISAGKKGKKNWPLILVSITHNNHEDIREDQYFRDGYV